MAYKMKTEICVFQLLFEHSEDWQSKQDAGAYHLGRGRRVSVEGKIKKWRALKEAAFGM